MQTESGLYLEESMKDITVERLEGNVQALSKGSTYMSDTISKTSDASVPLSFSAAIDHLCDTLRQGIESCIPAQFVGIR